MQVQKTLTEAEIQEFREIFSLVDKDGSGEITKAELGELMETLGLQVTPDTLDQMMSEVDADGSGDIDFSEFVAVMSRKVEATYTSEQLKNAFKVFETGEPGYVRVEVLKHAMMTYGEERLPAEKADELIALLSSDTNGKINYIDYVNSMSGES